MKTIERHKLIQDGVALYRALSHWFGEGGKPVAQEVAQRRADVCLKCPFNDPSEDADAIFRQGASLAIRKILELKRSQQLRVNEEGKLYLCAACKCVLKLKVFVPIKFVLETTNTKRLAELCAEKGVSCWILEEQKGAV